MADRTIRVTVVGDNRSLKSALKGSEQSLRSLDATAAKSQASLSKMESGFASFGKSAALVAGASAISAAFLQVVDSASRLQTATAANERIWGAQAGSMQDAAKAAADYGLAQADYLQTAAKLGSQLRNLGADQDTAATSAQSLMRMGENLAATFGTDVPQAVTAISAALRGEFDPLEQYGIGITAAGVAAKQSAEGISKAQAIIDIAMEQSKLTIGAAAQAQDTFAGKQRALAANFENAKAAVGEGFLPAASGAVDVMNALAKAVQAVPEGLRSLTGTAVAAGVAIKALQVLTGMGAAKTAAWAASLKASETYVASGAVTMGRVSAGLTKTAAALPWVATAVIGLGEAYAFLDAKAREAAVSQEDLTKAVTGVGDMSSISTVADQIKAMSAAQGDAVRQSEQWTAMLTGFVGVISNSFRSADMASGQQSIDNLNQSLAEFMAVNPAAGAAATKAAFNELVAAGVPADQATQHLAGSLARADQITRQFGQSTIDAAAKVQGLVAAFDAASARAQSFGHALDAVFADLDVGVAMQGFREQIAGLKDMSAGGFDAGEIQQLSQSWQQVATSMMTAGKSTDQITARYDAMRATMRRALADVGVTGRQAAAILDKVFGKRADIVATIKANADPAIDAAKRADKALKGVKQSGPAKILAKWLGGGDTNKADKDIDGVRQDHPASIDADPSGAVDAAFTAGNALSAVERTYTAVLNVVLNLGEGVQAWVDRVFGGGDWYDWSFGDEDADLFGPQTRSATSTIERLFGARSRAAKRAVEQVVVVRLKTEGDWTVAIKGMQKLQDLATKTNQEGKLTPAAKSAREQLRIRRQLADAANEFLRNVTTAYQGEERSYGWLRRKLDQLREARTQLAREMAEAISAVDIGAAWSQVQSNAGELASNIAAIRDEMDGLKKERAATWNPREIEYYNSKILQAALRLKAARQAQSQNTLAKQLQQQLDRTTKFYNKIDELRRKGLSNAALQELVRTGADQGAAIADALAGNDALRRKYDDVFKAADQMAKDLGSTIADDAYAARIKEIEDSIRRLRREVQQWLTAHKQIKWTINWVDVSPKRNTTRAYASPTLSTGQQQRAAATPQRIDLHVHGNLVDPEGAARAMRKVLRDSANRNGKLSWVGAGAA